MKNKIPPFLQEQFQKKMPKIRFFPNEVKQFMLDYNEYYDLQIPLDNMKLIYKLIKQGITKREICQLEDCDKLQGFDVLDKMTIGCCRSHSQKITSLERFGVDNYYKTKEFQEKKRTTCLEKFGVEHQSQSEEIREKTKQTCLENFGVEHAIHDPIVKEKARSNMMKTIPEALKKREETMLKRFGETTNLKCKETKEKIKKTNMEKYGVSNPMQHSSIQSKLIKTMIEKYGVKHSLQIPEICEKQQKKRYKTKNYQWKTGEISKVQGYENKVLSDLENSGYSFNDILTNKSDMPEIWYEFKGEKRRYFPDIFIPKENLLLEVKSTYTISQEVDKNEKKWEATRSLGYDFRIEVK